MDLRPFGTSAEFTPTTPTDPETQQKVIKYGAIGAGVVALVYLLTRGTSKSTSVSSKSVVASGTVVPITTAPSYVPPMSGGGGISGGLPTPLYKISITPSSTDIDAGNQVKIQVSLKQDSYLTGSSLRITIALPDNDLVQEFSIANQPEQTVNATFSIPNTVLSGHYKVSASVMSGTTALSIQTISLGIIGSPLNQGGSSVGAAPIAPTAPVGLTTPFSMSFWPTYQRVSWMNPTGTKWILFEMEAAVTQAGKAIPLGMQPQVLQAPANKYDIPTPKIGGGSYVLIPDKEYIWRVSISTQDNKPTPTDYSSWGPPSQSKFSTPIASSGGIQVMRPQNGSVDISTTDLVLRWIDSDQHIFMYEINVAADEKFANTVVSKLIHGGETTPNNSWTPATDHEGGFTPAPGTKYWWRIRPYTETGVGWSTVWTFTTTGTATSSSGGTTTGGSTGSSGGSSATQPQPATTPTTTKTQPVSPLPSPPQPTATIPGKTWDMASGTWNPTGTKPNQGNFLGMDDEGNPRWSNPQNTHATNYTDVADTSIKVSSLDATVVAVNRGGDALVTVTAQAPASIPNGLIQIEVPDFSYVDHAQWSNSTAFSKEFDIKVPVDATLGLHIIKVTAFSDQKALKQTTKQLQVTAPQSTPPPPKKPVIPSTPANADITWDASGDTASKRIKVSVRAWVGVDNVEIWAAGSDTGGVPNPNTWTLIASKTGQSSGFSATVSTDYFSAYPGVTVAVVGKLGVQTVITGNPTDPHGYYRLNLSKGYKNPSYTPPAAGKASQLDHMDYMVIR